MQEAEYETTRACMVCGIALAQREGEKPSRFKRRKTCSAECNHEQLRRRRPDTGFKGDAATEHAKRNRAQRRYSLAGVVCEESGCEKPAKDRHHKNEDPGDNRRENLEFLCRAHHRLRHTVAKLACSNCGREIEVGKRRKGRCKSCAAYFGRTGRERPWKVDGRREGAGRGVQKPALRRDPVACSNCGELTKPPRLGRCRRCYDYWRYYGKRVERPVQASAK